MSNQYVWNMKFQSGLHVYATQQPVEVVGGLIDFGGSTYALIMPNMLTGNGCSISRNGDDVYITVGGSGGAVAVGHNTTAVSSGGVHVRGNVSGSIFTGSTRW